MAAKRVNSRITTESKRQALDWSLVLVSQGIDCAVDRDAEKGWGVLVDESAHDRALQTIQQYRAENSHWPWQQKMFRPEISFDWGCLAWVIALCIFFWLSARAPGFREAGVMNGQAVLRGDWWRLFTSVFLHADIGHLASNAGIGFVLLGLVMGRFGTGIGLLAAFFAGAGGNVAALLVYKSHHQSLGASGMVMGCLGLLAAQSVSLSLRNKIAAKFAVAAAAAGILLFALTGLSPGTDVVAHFGGFVTGGLLGTILTFAPRLARNTGANMLAGILFAAVVVSSWLLAARTMH